MIRTYSAAKCQSIVQYAQIKDAKINQSTCEVSGDISRFFPLIDLIFPWEALNQFFGAQDEGFSEFRSR